MQPRFALLFAAILTFIFTSDVRVSLSQTILTEAQTQPSLRFPWRNGGSSLVFNTTHSWNNVTYNAIDFDFPNNVAGDYVLAAQNGRVVAASYADPGWGNYVKLDHGNGYYTLYAHMARGTVRVRYGQEVTQGQILGEVGCTGTCTGDHLHFELYEGVTRIWPRFSECNCIPQQGTRYYSQNDIYIQFAADINVFRYGVCGDGAINILDYGVLSDNFGEAPTDHPCADINDDGRVNILDYNVLFTNWREYRSLTTFQTESDLAPTSLPNPPSNISFVSESNVYDTQVAVKMSWDDNSDNETGFAFTWNIDGYGERSVTQLNATPPSPPEEQGPSSDNNKESVLAILPCGESNYQRAVNASIAAFNDSGSSEVVPGTGVVEIPACPIAGDANGDRKVDGFDYVIWWQHFSQTTENGHFDGDFSYDGFVDGIDYVIWWQNFGR